MSEDLGLGLPDKDDVTPPDVRRELIQDYSKRCRELLKLLNRSQGLNINKALGLINDPDLISKDEFVFTSVFQNAMNLVHTAILERGGEAYGKHLSPDNPEDEISLEEAEACVEEMLAVFKNQPW